MARWGRRLPSGAREALGLAPGERVVGWTTARGEPVVATTLALHAEALGRIGWDAIARARWDDPVLEIIPVSDTTPTPLRIALDAPGSLPDAVHALVTGSVVVSERLDLGDGRGALAVARRSPQDGSVRWSVAFDAGLDPRDPALRTRADEVLAGLRSSLGI